MKAWLASGAQVEALQEVCQGLNPLTPVPVLRLIGAGGNLQKPNKRSPNALLSVSRQIKGCLQMLNVHASWAWRCESAQEHVEV